MKGDPKSRMRWHLRAERAFGLTSVRLTSAEAVQEPPEQERAGERAPAPAGSGGSVKALDAMEDARRIPRSNAPVVKPTQVAAAAPMPADVLYAPDADAPAFDAPPLTPDEKRQRLVAMDANEVRGCTKCRLCETRTNTVFGEGDPDAKIFFIGEGPGENEDLQGRPFIGRAGELLNKWIAAMGLAREQVFIANIVKCRPPNNREPAPDEVATCTPYLQRQLEVVRPRVIITLGRPSAQYMLQSKLAMGKLRGNWHAWRGIKLMPTYHPAYVLRQYTVETRGAVWADLQKVMAELNLPVPPRKGADR
ncbi:MAG: Uracil-DNA glycosylase, family 4 [uncultured Phycisphaerae bacterium]|uniref:Type-4 uracil-DNA glycosylase n=1 Tax=uncultured Phycisphaerae bacterium TaxID=904963 RepID=A0A6J4NAA8_9BACT|nr:MAG: Uracil-DNA glycosylase, family 4 [uncultured Phycisphaerae bacterium]